MRRSDSIAELSKALTAFQKNAPKITKDKTAKIGAYSYDYADLASIWDKIRGPLADNGLSLIQSPTVLSSEPALCTVLAHESGEWIEDTMPLKVVQDTPQGQGSAITYARRYALSAILGIVADSDNDAQDHKTLSAVQKKQIYDTARQQVPELEEDHLAMVRFLTEMTGKHPSRLLASEFEDALAAVESYSKEVVADA